MPGGLGLAQYYEGPIPGGGFLFNTPGGSVITGSVTRQDTGAGFGPTATAPVAAPPSCDPNKGCFPAGVPQSPDLGTLLGSIFGPATGGGGGSVDTSNLPQSQSQVVQQNPVSPIVYLMIAAAIGLVIFWWRHRKQKKKEE